MVLRGGEVVPADLVIDASGRFSHLPAWLAEAGWAKPEVQVVDSQICYVSRMVRARPSIVFHYMVHEPTTWPHDVVHSIARACRGSQGCAASLAISTWGGAFQQIVGGQSQEEGKSTVFNAWAWMLGLRLVPPAPPGCAAVPSCALPARPSACPTQQLLVWCNAFNTPASRCAAPPRLQMQLPEGWYSSPTGPKGVVIFGRPHMRRSGAALPAESGAAAVSCRLQPGGVPGWPGLARPGSLHVQGFLTSRCVPN